MNISRKPSEYLRNLYYDVCTSRRCSWRSWPGWDPTVSSWAVTSRWGDTDPVGFVSRCDALSPAEADMVLGGTAGQLLGFTANGDELGVAAG